MSTPHDIRFGAFCDGSHRKDRGGGVALVYNKLWLPQECTDGPTDASRGWHVKKAWWYGESAGQLVMEAIGVLESLYAANEEIKQHLAVLEKHGSTVLVKVTTDCQSVLRRITATKPGGARARTRFPPLLYQQIKEMIVTLQGYGIRVVVEMHWCPRNAVPHMLTADELAGEAMETGRGCNKGTWSEGIKSVIMKQLVPRLPESVSYTRSVPDTDGAATSPKTRRRGNKMGKREAEDEVGDDRPTKKAKKSQQLRRMPASWGLDPETMVFIWNSKKREMERKPVVSCPYIRKVGASTMQTREKNVFVNDGVSGFSVAEPTGMAGKTRIMGGI